MKLKKHVRSHLHSILCVLLVAVLVASSISAGSLAVSAAPLTLDIGVSAGSVTATLKENGVLSITGAGEIRDFTEETAPFEDWNVKSVEFGAGVTSIGDYTFYNCSGLDGVLTLPKGVVRIGSHAFSGKTERLAPKPGFVENLFVEALVTSVEKSTGDASSAVTEEPAESAPAEDPTENDAQEGGTGDVMLSEEKTTNTSGPEEDEETDSSDPEESTAPAEPEQETPSAAETTPEQKDIYTVTKVKEQELGEEIFFPRKEAGAFTCSDENKTFRAAMEKAGFQKADSKVAVILNSGEGLADGGDMQKNLPVLSGNLILPALPPEFSAPEEEELFSYEFGGWTEKDDAAGMVRKPGSLFPVGEKSEFYFIANWTKIVKLAIEARRVKDTVTYSVPEIAGYDVLSYQWQTRMGQGEWTTVADATEQQYSRKLQPGDGDRAFRCTITVQKQQNLLVRLFAAAQTEELSLTEVQSGLTERSETIAVQKGSGVQTVSKTISLPVSEGGSSYSITKVELPAGAEFVDADAAALPADGKTFVLTVAPTGDNWQAAGSKAQLVSGEREWASGVEHLLQTGDFITNDAGTAELEVTLQYNAGYETFSGGTIGLTLEETLPGEDGGNLVTAAVLLADKNDVTQDAFAVSGRGFVFGGGNDAVITPEGGLTVGFETEYYPAAAGATNSRLYIYKADGTPSQFPAGTTLVMVDASGDTWNYYYYNAGGRASLLLSNLTSISQSDGKYSGPAQADVYTRERLLFVFDFSQANFDEGGYYLTLTHSLQPGAVDPAKKASFTVKEDSGAASFSAEKAEESDTLWSVKLNAVHSYQSGIWVQATLLDKDGKQAAFPAEMKLDGAEAIGRNDDGSVQFVPQGDTVTFDFSGVAAGALASGEYQVQLEMRPRPGLQNGGETTSTSIKAGNLTFTYKDKEPAAKPAVRSLSVSAAERLLDASEKAATLELTITYENAQDGDALQIKVLEKGEKTDPNDYQEQTTISPITVGNISELTGGAGKHTQTVTLTVPKGKEEGTFRALVSILDADGRSVAEEPYNFIIK